MTIEYRRTRDLLADASGFDGISIPALGMIGGGEPRQGHLVGIKALMVAVLDDAIVLYLGRPGRLRDEAEAWIMSSTRRSPFAFAVICDSLLLEPSAVRAVLQQWREQSVPVRAVLGRTRNNARAVSRA